MTEFVNEAPQISSEAPQAVSSPTPAPAPVQTAPAPQAPERTYRGEDVAEIVKRERQEAVERFKRLQVEQPEYARQKYPDYQPQPQQPPEEVYRKIASEEFQRNYERMQSETQAKYQQQEAERFVSEFTGKLAAGKEKYADFDEVAGTIQHANFTRAIQLANMVDNTADVMYELGKDRTKLFMLEQLAGMSPNDAVHEMKKLSQSLKANEAARNVRMPNSPLSQLKPSSAGLGNNSALTAQDYKLRYRNLGKK